jgi:ADP-heptose:LPS heptosyltransferase
MKSKPKKHLLIVWLNGIGDLVMSLPALTKFQETEQFTHVTVLSRNNISSLLLNTVAFDRIPINFLITQKKRPHFDLLLIQKLRQSEIDVGITLFPTQGISSALLLKFSGAKKRYHHEYRFKWFNHIHWGINKSAKIIQDHHIAEQMNYLLNQKLQINIKLIDTLKLTLPTKKTNIGIHCTPSEFKSHREWGNKNWKELITFCLINYTEDIHVFWGNGDEDDMLKFKKFIPSERVYHHYNLDIKTLLDQLFSLKLFIGIDSGIGHLASISEMDQIILYGPFNEKYSQPLNKKAVTVRPKDTTSNFIPYENSFQQSLPKLSHLNVKNVINLVKKTLR